MKKARLIKSGEFIQASEAKYDDHQGIYQCPHCKSALHLRKEYTRSDGIIVSAAFIHPSHGTEEQKNCPLRIQMIFDETDCIMTQPISRGQLYKLLKKNFLKCIKLDCKYEICQYYTSYPYQGAEVIRNTKFILKVSNTIIKSTRTPQYSMEQLDKIKALIASKSSHNNLFNNNDINRISWCLDFLINEVDDIFRIKVLSYIYGKYASNSSTHIEKDINNKIKTILGFSIKSLEVAEKVAEIIITNCKLTNDYIYQTHKLFKEELSINKLNYDQYESVCNIIFTYIINYLINFNWDSLVQL